jgi:ADP-ribose pyrophosphatase
MWKKIHSEKIFTHPRLTLIEDTVELPDGTQVPYLTFESDANGSTVICINDKSEVLVQQEYTYPQQKIMYQFPGGRSDHGEDLETTARRELREESGYDAVDLTHLGWFYAYNRRSNEKIHIYIARNPVPVERTGGDIEEVIHSEWIPIDTFTKMVADGEVPNFVALAAWALFMSKRHELDIAA